MRVWSCFESLGRGVAAGVDVPCWRRARGRARACKRLCCGHYGWERGWGRVSEYLFVTFSHMSKYAFIVVRCWRLEGVGFLHIALLRFCETVYGPFGRHSYNWAARIFTQVTKCHKKAHTHALPPALPLTHLARQTMAPLGAAAAAPPPRRSTCRQQPTAHIQIHIRITTTNPPPRDSAHTWPHATA